MKRLLFGTTVILIFAFLAFGQKAAVGKADPTKGVHEAFDRLIDGIKQVDVDKVMGSYEKSDHLLIFNNNGSATNGWAAKQRPDGPDGAPSKRRAAPKFIREQQFIISRR